MSAPTAAAEHVARNEAAGLLDRTHRVRLPNGETCEVNRFDFNMHRFADLDGESDRYIQLACGAWIRHRKLEFLAPSEGSGA